MQDECNCEYFHQECQPRPDMPNLDHTFRLFLRAKRDIAVGEELLVFYGLQYFQLHGLMPRVRQPVPIQGPVLVPIVDAAAAPDEELPDTAD